MGLQASSPFLRLYRHPTYVTQRHDKYRRGREEDMTDVRKWKIVLMIKVGKKKYRHFSE